MDELSPKALDRRTLLKRGAIVGGTAVWAIPAVQAFSMTAAGAATPSGAPTSPNPGPPTTHTPAPPTKTSPSKGADASSTHHSAPTSTSTSPTSGTPGSSSSGGAGVDSNTKHKITGLASTGPAVPIAEALAVGLGAIAIGSAATVAGRRAHDGPASDGRPRPRPTHLG